jgi:hypothetical protein
MINLLGKSLAVVHAGLSVMLMAFAIALYVNAVDFGWKVPRREYIESEKRPPGKNLAVPSNYDKREAAMRRVARAKYDAVVRLGVAQASYIEVEPFLGDNHVRADAELDRLENAPSGAPLDIRTFKFDGETGLLVLEAGTNRQLGFPVLDPVVPNVNKSLATYKGELKAWDTKIRLAQKDTEDILAKEKALTIRMIGLVDKDGNQIKEGGAVVQPGWYYLMEVESATHRILKREINDLQPLWVKELVDSQLLISRREILKRRLEELGDKGYMSQSQFLKDLKKLN